MLHAVSCEVMPQASRGVRANAKGRDPTMTEQTAHSEATKPAEVWTMKRCLLWTEEFLASHGEERPRVAAEWLLSAATGQSRIQVYMNHAEPLTKEELAFMHQAVIRRSHGEPLQYITGETGFRTLSVACEPGVLIPRPETELLVEIVLDYLDREVIGAPEPERRARVALPWNDEVERMREAEEAAARERAEDEAEAGDEDDPEAEAEAVLDAAPEPAPASDGTFARVLEVGCGTGCISLSLAAERRGRVRCLATDIEPRAVNLARRNRERAGLTNGEVAFLLGDLVAPVPKNVYGTFDALVSNPPYIPSQVMETLPHEVVDYEPALALEGGADGLDVFRRLLAEAPRMLRPGGLFACELFEGALDDAAALCRAAGLVDVSVHPDLTHRPRFVLARTPTEN